jgi:uncharacterized membrane protein YkvA (DUF1232 family)
MDEQRTLFPAGLNRRLSKILTEHTHQADGRPVAELLTQAAAHLDVVRAAHRQNTLVNLRLAEAICGAIKRVVDEWAAMPAAAQPWLLGAIAYFAHQFDEQPDLASPIGFEDDAEVLNACLRLAGRDELCLKPEEFDGV